MTVLPNQVFARPGSVATAGLLLAVFTAAAFQPTAARASGAVPLETSNMPSRSDRLTVEEAVRAIYRAKLAADADALATLLGAGYTLTHMTGFVQPRADWLADVRSRAMAYHAAREISLDTRVDGDRATVTSRHVVDATIHGVSGTWNLQLTTDFMRREGRWIAARTVATTFR